MGSGCARTSLHVRHTRRRNTVWIHDWIVISAALGTAGQSLLVEEIPLGRHDPVLSLLFVCSSPLVDEIPFFWMFCNIVFFFLVYLFQFSLELGKPGFVRRGWLGLVRKGLYIIFDVCTRGQKWSSERDECGTCSVFFDECQVARLVAFCLVLLQGQVNGSV
jgi:hypothetical protein